jgi:hypothetical protein
MHKERRSHAAEVSSGHWPSTGSTGTTARLGRRHWYAGVDSLDGGAPWLVFSVRNNHRCLAVSVDSSVSILIAIQVIESYSYTVLVWSSASLVEGTAPPTLPPTHAPDVTRADGGECRPRAPTGNKLANV